MQYNYNKINSKVKDDMQRQTDEHQEKAFFNPLRTSSEKSHGHVLSLGHKAQELQVLH